MKSGSKYINARRAPDRMDIDNSSLRSRPPRPEVLKENLAKIDSELARCHERLRDLEVLRSLEDNDNEGDAAVTSDQGKRG